MIIYTSHKLRRKRRVVGRRCLTFHQQTVSACRRLRSDAAATRSGRGGHAGGFFAHISHVLYILYEEANVCRQAHDVDPHGSEGFQRSLIMQHKDVRSKHAGQGFPSPRFSARVGSIALELRL